MKVNGSLIVLLLYQKFIGTSPHCTEKLYKDSRCGASEEETAPFQTNYNDIPDIFIHDRGKLGLMKNSAIDLNDATSTIVKKNLKFDLNLTPDCDPEDNVDQTDNISIINEPKLNHHGNYANPSYGCLTNLNDSQEKSTLDAEVISSDLLACKKQFSRDAINNSGKRDLILLDETQGTSEHIPRSFPPGVLRDDLGEDMITSPQGRSQTNQVYSSGNYVHRKSCDGSSSPIVISPKQPVSVLDNSRKERTPKVQTKRRRTKSLMEINDRNQYSSVAETARLPSLNSVLSGKHDSPGNSIFGSNSARMFLGVASGHPTRAITRKREPSYQKKRKIPNDEEPNTSDGIALSWRKLDPNLPIVSPSISRMNKKSKNEDTVEVLHRKENHTSNKNALEKKRDSKQEKQWAAARTAMKAFTFTKFDFVEEYLSYKSSMNIVPNLSRFLSTESFTKVLKVNHISKGVEGELEDESIKRKILSFEMVWDEKDKAISSMKSYVDHSQYFRNKKKWLRHQKFIKKCINRRTHQQSLSCEEYLLSSAVDLTSDQAYMFSMIHSYLEWLGNTSEHTYWKDFEQFAHIRGKPSQ